MPFRMPVSVAARILHGQAPRALISSKAGRKGNHQGREGDRAASRVPAVIASRVVFIISFREMGQRDIRPFRSDVRSGPNSEVRMANREIGLGLNNGHPQPGL